jgi:hypothetical protein
MQWLERIEDEGERSSDDAESEFDREFVTNCEQTLQDFNDGMGTWGAIRSQARSIFNNGGWDNEVDLFSVLNLE